MAKISNNFIKGRMNKDLDDRLIPVGEYRNAMNAQVSKSEGQNVGALENVLGNIKIADFRTLASVNDLQSIGYFADEINNRVYVFLTNNTGSAYDPSKKHFLYVYNTLTSTTNRLLQGAFLNFSTQNPMIGVNLLEDLLFFTDNRNQPRVININSALANSQSLKDFYTNEDQISVAKYYPYKPIEVYRKSADLPITYIDTVTYTVPNVSYPAGTTFSVDTSAAGPGNNPAITVGMTMFCKSNCTAFTNMPGIPADTVVASSTATSINTYDITVDKDIDLRGGNGKLYFTSVPDEGAYETTMYDVTSKAYPNGGTGNINGTLNNATSTVDLISSTIQGDIIPPYTGSTGATVAYINPTTGKLIPTDATVVTFNYSSGATTSQVTLSENIGPFSEANVELVFNYNHYYDHEFNGDKDFLRDKFIRFSYRYKFENNEYSIMAPFTQECFIPKKDGYFMYKVTGSRTTPPPLDIQDEEDTYRSTIVEFMENKVDKIILRVPPPVNMTGADVLKGSLANTFRISEVDILYKESDGLAVNVIESIPISTVQSGYKYAFVNGQVTNSTSITIDNLSGVTGSEIKVGDIVRGDGIVGAPTVISTNNVNNVVLSSAQSLLDNTRLDFGDEYYFEYSYQSQKPYKVLPDSEVTRTYDKIPVRAFGQEIISNRVVYANYQDKHTPPESINYNVGVSQKTAFNAGTGSTTTSASEASGQTVLSVNTPTGVYNNGAIVTSPTSGIPNNTTLVDYDSAGPTITISNALTATLPSGTEINFTAPNNVRYTTSDIEYPNSSLKQNRNYQVGVVLSDRYGRTSTVILNDQEDSRLFLNQRYKGSTVFSDYLDTGVDQVSWFGDSLKVLFNDPISGGGAGIYNGDATSSDYNPLGWHSYKVVVKQTEQEYYNVYLPGVMAAYPEDPTKELGKTSHAVLINDNINKVPRDLALVGPEQRQFRSSVVLHGRVENLKSNDPAENNKQYYPGALPPVVSVIATDNDLFDGVNDADYAPSTEFYNVDSDPLIARINTPSKQFGVASTIVTGDVGSLTLNNNALNTVGLTPNTISPSVNAIVPGQKISGPGIFPGTEVVSASNDSGFRKIVMTQDRAVGIANGDTLTFAPTPFDANQTWVTMPQLAVMETDPVTSNLDIFWESTTAGLINDLNEAILNSTQSSVNLSSFNTDNFTEAIVPNQSGATSRILSANFTLQDAFGNDIDYIDQSPAQIVLTSVFNLQGDDVGPGSTNPMFELETIANTPGSPGVYNIKAKEFFYFSDQNQTKDTFTFTFTLNINGTESVITKTPVALGNENPTIAQSGSTACPGSVTYTVGTSGNGQGTIANVGGFNGSAGTLQGLANLDLDTSLSVTKGGIQYAQGGSNDVLVDTTTPSTALVARIYFAGGDPPNSMADGVYVVALTFEDAGGDNVTCTFNLTIDRDPCFTYKRNYQGTGNVISATYTDCLGDATASVNYVDPPSNQFPGYDAVCAIDNQTTLINAGYTKLPLNSTDPANTCNGL
jgi:hypothetical protein